MVYRPRLQPWARIAASSAQTSPGVDALLAGPMEVDAEPEVVLDLDEQVGEAVRSAGSGVLGRI